MLLLMDCQVGDQSRPAVFNHVAVRLSKRRSSGYRLDPTRGCEAIVDVLSATRKRSTDRFHQPRFS